MKNNYKGFKGWLKYVRDYKDNVDNDLISEHRLINANKKIEKQAKFIEEHKFIKQEQDELIKKLDIRTQILTNKLSETKKENVKLQNMIDILNAQIDDLENKIQEKEISRRKCAGQIGGLKAKISVLKKDLARANMKIQWLSNNQKAPTKEEIIAYDLQMKEVEKKLKK